MTMPILTGRAFHQDLSRAKRIAADSPVIIADHAAQNL